MFLTKCPLCDSPNIHQLEGTVERKIHGEFIIVPGVENWFGPDCGEKIFFPVDIKAMNDYIKRNVKEAVMVD